MPLIRSFRHKGLEAFFRKGIKADARGPLTPPAGEAGYRKFSAGHEPARLALASTKRRGSGTVVGAGERQLAPHLYVNEMTQIHNPGHPGEILNEDVLPSLGLSVTEAVAQLGVSRVTLLRLINGRAAPSADMALRLAAWLPPSAESWLRMQDTYDLWQSSRKRRPRIKPAPTHAV